MSSQSIEIVLSDDQLKKVESQVYQTMIDGIEKVSESKLQKTWMKSSDLKDYLPIADSTIREHLNDLPFHTIGGTKFYNKNEIDNYILNK